MKTTTVILEKWQIDRLLAYCQRDAKAFVYVNFTEEGKLLGITLSLPLGESDVLSNFQVKGRQE